MGTCENGRWKTQKTTFETGTRVLQKCSSGEKQSRQCWRQETSSITKLETPQSWFPLQLLTIETYRKLKIGANKPVLNTIIPAKFHGPSPTITSFTIHLWDVQGQ